MVKQSKSSQKSKPQAQAKEAVAAANAVELLTAEHGEVAELFDTFESADTAEQQGLAEQICRKLTVHAQIEEEILYPAAKDLLEDDDVDLVNEAAVEHATVKDLIVKLEDMDATDEFYKATVTVLGEYVKHHVEEEETELFPLLQDSDLDLEAMGVELAGRKQELMAELGTDMAAIPGKRTERDVRDPVQAGR
ncbi:hemerythrin domain-containing protein [Peristeroidobacter agariperforans]|uniref:hemerythrin domain-containing protein n=1 Tax=Peristeroidobacter agariperforans TaxID=268404 RepID=UPI00101DF4F5|nr:hemerythrin domain-containing protein [Peristeroidobacter agariperforans]